MQLLPFLGWYIGRRRRFAFFKEIQRLALVCTAGFAYLGLVLLLVWQALRGQSVVHPDFHTLASGIILALVAGVATGAIYLQGARSGVDTSRLGSTSISNDAGDALKVWPQARKK